MTHCTKVKYSTQAFALQDIVRIQARSKENKYPINTYLCPNCHCWHLTSQGQIEFSIEDKLKKKIERLQDRIAKLQMKPAKTGTIEQLDRIKSLEDKLSKQGIKMAALKNEIFRLHTENNTLKREIEKLKQPQQ